jgi:hypothetical protein
MLAGGDYIYPRTHVMETDPDDGNPWTQTKLEAAEFGIILVDSDTTTSTTTSTTTTT